MSKKLNKRTLELEETEKSFGKGKFNGKKGRKGNFYKGKESNPLSSHLGKNPQMLKDLCSIPFNAMAGFTIRLKNYYTRLGYVRSFFADWFAGISSDFRSMLNTAATNIGTFVRSRNSGATNYQFSDIFTAAILGCLDVMATLEYMRRFFQSTDVYSVFNRLTPKVVFSALGIDYEDFIANIANYRGKFNIIMAKASSLVVPKQFGIYDWVLSWYRDIFKDRDSSSGKEQLYIIGKQLFHIYDPKGDPNGGMIRLMNLGDLDPNVAAADKDKVLVLSPSTNNGNGIKFSKLLDIVNVQLDALITDEDVNIIFGDLIKAYGNEGNFWKAVPVSETDKIVPVYSEEFLEQLHNSIALPRIGAIDTALSDSSRIGAYPSAYLKNNIKQDAQGYLLTEWQYNSVTFGADHLDIWDSNLLLDTNEQQPNPEKVMIMTRWHNRYKVTQMKGQANAQFTISAASAMILYEGYMYIGDVSSNVITKLPAWQFVDIGDLTGTEREFLLNQSNFDWTPLMYVMDDNTPGKTYINGDINNVVPVDTETLSRIHEVDFASLLDVPFSGSF